MTINNRFTEIEQTKMVETRVVRADRTKDRKSTDVLREHLMEVLINEKPFLRLVCTPAGLVELVLGRCVTEGIINSSEDVESLFICESGSRARIYLRKELEMTAGTDEQQIELTCCTDNRLLGNFQTGKKLAPLEPAAYSEKDIFALADRFQENAALHKKTKGTHSCYLSCQGICRGGFEDIGRHNAIDKAVGYALMNNLDYQDCILFTTGRVPVDMIRKAVMAGIPILVSKAVPTVEAIEMAKRYNVTLICRAWPDSYEIYHEAKMSGGAWLKDGNRRMH